MVHCNQYSFISYLVFSQPSLNKSQAGSLPHLMLTNHCTVLDLMWLCLKIMKRISGIETWNLIILREYVIPISGNVN